MNRLLAAAGVCLTLFLATRGWGTGPRRLGEADEALGRAVYVAEGCIHCHSQFVRPGTSDELLWGPATSTEQTLAQSPPLIGNRRQGPDLANVGNRRSPQWNRIHLIDPRTLSPDSVMPSYAHLFTQRDPRGESLILYLSSLGESTAAEREKARVTWVPGTTLAAGNSLRGRSLLEKNCAQCHGIDGGGNGALSALIAPWKPRDLQAAKWQRIPRKLTDEELGTELARIVKFGIVGTPMAGHEYWSDQEVIDVVRYVLTLSRKVETP